MNIFLIVGAIIFSIFYLQKKTKQTRQLRYIEQYSFHPGICKKVAQQYPHLTEQQLALVFQCLKDYFRLCQKAKKRMVAMPSQVVDAAWHEFILSTRSYDGFCKQTLGYFLHHTPATAMATPTMAQDSIKRAWRLACALEKINPKTPDRLPRLFAIDGLLQIEGGFVYQLNCTLTNSGDFCVNDINCSSDCGGDSAADSGDSGCGGDGGGCGGD